MPAVPPADSLQVVLGILQAGMLSANTDGVSVFVDDGGTSGKFVQVAEKTDVARLYRGGPARIEAVGHSKDYYTREDLVVVDLETAGDQDGNASNTAVAIRQHHMNVQNEVNRVLMGSRKNPSADWDYLFPREWVFYKEYHDDVASRLTVYVRRLWHLVET